MTPGFLALRELNDQLLDANYNLLHRLISLYKQQGIRVDSETMALVAQVRVILHNMAMPTRENNQSKHYSDTTEPFFRYNVIVNHFSLVEDMKCVTVFN